MNIFATLVDPQHISLLAWIMTGIIAIIGIALTVIGYLIKQTFKNFNERLSKLENCPIDLKSCSARHIQTDERFKEGNKIFDKLDDKIEKLTVAIKDGFTRLAQGNLIIARSQLQLCQHAAQDCSEIQRLVEEMTRQAAHDFARPWRESETS